LQRCDLEPAAALLLLKPHVHRELIAHALAHGVQHEGRGAEPHVQLRVVAAAGNPSSEGSQDHRNALQHSWDCAKRFLRVILPWFRASTSTELDRADGLDVAFLGRALLVLRDGDQATVEDGHGGILVDKRHDLGDPLVDEASSVMVALLSGAFAQRNVAQQ
jgi:hypothetical protein